MRTQRKHFDDADELQKTVIYLKSSRVIEVSPSDQLLD